MAAQSAASGGDLVVLASLLDISEPDTGEPTITKLCPVATVARIKQLIRTPDGDTRLIAEGLCRAQLSAVMELGKFCIANVISKTVNWSVESYVAQTRAKTTATANEIAVVNAMLTYGDSVAAYMAAK